MISQQPRNLVDHHDCHEQKKEDCGLIKAASKSVNAAVATLGPTQSVGMLIEANKLYYEMRQKVKNKERERNEVGLMEECQRVRKHQKEMDAIKGCFNVLEEGSTPPPGYKDLTYHLIMDVKS